MGFSENVLILFNLFAPSANITIRFSSKIISNPLKKLTKMYIDPH